MLFRRVLQHVKDQNWTAVGVDFLIVVIGVFVGLQVSNWNDTRIERQLGREYVERLIFDLRYDLRANRSLARYHEEVLKNVVEADRLLANPDSDAEELIVAIYRASETALRPAKRSTWDQIISSGHLGVLPADTLDGGLSEYYSVLDSRSEWYVPLTASPFRKAIRDTIPLQMQLAIRDGCGDILDDDGVISGFISSCVIDQEPTEFSATVQAVRNSSEISSSLRNQYSLVLSELSGHLANKRLIEKSLTTLESVQSD